MITKLKLHNYKRFRDTEIPLNSGLNVLVGDNEVGKSSILQAIDLVGSGSLSKIENIGIEHLFNKQVIDEYMALPSRCYDALPIMYVEIYLDNSSNQWLFGRNHSDGGIDCFGLRFRCEPNPEYLTQITDILNSKDSSFPFEFYSVRYSTFADKTYNGHTRFMHGIFVDNSSVNSECAMREYINDLYHTSLTSMDQSKLKHLYSRFKQDFQTNYLRQYSENLWHDGYEFALKSSPKNNVDADLTIQVYGIPMEQKGRGQQCFVKTELALSRADTPQDYILIEEPENHLSYTKMAELVELVKNSNAEQIFVTTHSSLICARLELQNVIMLGANADSSPISLRCVSQGTNDFFVKATNHNLLEFVLASKVILVEGDAEYILMNKFYSLVRGHDLQQDSVAVISVGGIRFLRYLEIAKLLGIKVAVITDNDGDYHNNIEQKYIDYQSCETIKVFSDADNNRYTFEVCVYGDNKTMCDQLWASARRSISVEKYMLENKADVAMELLTQSGMVVPSYIKDAIQWLNN